MPKIRYNVVVNNGDASPIIIDWGNTPGWLETFRAELDSTSRISLIPKDGEALPAVTVRLEPGQRWILFSRVYGQVNGPGRIRCYAIGHQETVKGTCVKSILWIYPDGGIEHAEEPSYWRHHLNRTA